MKYLKSMLSIFPFSLLGGMIYAQVPAIKVPFLKDFEITSGIINPIWEHIPKHKLNKLDEDGREANTHFQIMYSERGIYIHFYGDEWKVTTEAKSDFEDLFKGDVYEVFFQPDESKSIYLEYEVNANNHELVLLIPNYGGQFLGWTPWKYEGARKIIKNSFLKANDHISIPFTWHAEIFFPYPIFNPMLKGKPEKGTIWKGNFYRLDYDLGKMVKWSWATISKSFHEFQKFGEIIFE